MRDKTFRKARKHRRMMDEVFHSQRLVACDVAAGRNIGETQNADIGAVETCDQRIGEYPVRACDDIDAEFACAYPCTGGELEVFGDAAVEDDAFFRVIGIDEAGAIAEPVETFIVIGFGSLCRVLVIALRDAITANANLKLLADRG